MREPIRRLTLAVLLLASIEASAADLRLIEAVRTSNSAAVQSLLRQRTDVNAAEADGTTALHWATRLEDLQTVDLLIRAGANVKAVNRYDISPLYLACVNGNGTLVETLLKAGADPNTALA